MKIHHVGYLVKDIMQSKACFELLGYTQKAPVVYDQIRNIDILFMKNDRTVVELIQSKGDSSTVSNLIKKFGVAPYHICYETDSLEYAIKELRSQKFIVTSSPMQAPALENRKVAFLYNKNMGIIELLEVNHE